MRTRTHYLSLAYFYVWCILLHVITHVMKITLANGTVVRPEDVLDPTVPHPDVLVVDCATTDYLPLMEASPAIAKLYR